MATEDKLIMIVGRCGQLGNRLVHFANFVALAEERKYRLMNLAFYSFAKSFEATRRDICCQYPALKKTGLRTAIPGISHKIGTPVLYRTARAMSKLGERWPAFNGTAVTLRDNPALYPGLKFTPLDGPEVQTKIGGARIIFANGWTFRAPDCVRRHAEKIRAYFRPIEPYEQSSSQALERLRKEADVVVGVHVRRGDYWDWKGGNYFYPASRYAQWMNQLADQFPGRKVSFLVCSDEPRDRSEFPGLSVGFGPNTSVGDMYALSKCDYIFGPQSTFSQWSSFVGNAPLFHLHSSNDQLELEKFAVSDLSDIP